MAQSSTMKLSTIKFRQLFGFLALACLVFLAVFASARNQPTVLKDSATRPSETKVFTASAKPIPRSLFGMHIADSDKIPWPAVPFATWRLWDAATRHGLAFWAHLERQKGQWDFRTLDYCVELAQRHGVELVYTMGITPKWASARPDKRSAYGDGPTPGEPKDMDDWRNYVRTVATRYKGKIRYYEIWNEPNLKHFYRGTVDQMVALAREAYTILKEIDPSIKVIAPSVFSDYGGWNWLDEYFGKGGGAYTDIVGAHFYIKKDKTPENSLWLIDKVQNVMAKHGLAEKPFWNTETGYGNKGENVFYSDEESMAYVARTYIVNWMSGIERFYWYAWDNRNVVTILMVEKDKKTLTPAAKAYAEIQKWLIGARMNKCESEKKTAWTCEFTGERGDPFWIVWNSKGERKFKVPEKYDVRQVHSLYGEKTPLPDNRLLKVGSLPLLLSRD